MSSTRAAQKAPAKKHMGREREQRLFRCRVHLAAAHAEAEKLPSSCSDALPRQNPCRASRTRQILGQSRTHIVTLSLAAHPNSPFPAGRGQRVRAAPLAGGEAAKLVCRALRYSSIDLRVSFRPCFEVNLCTLLSRRDSNTSSSLRATQRQAKPHRGLPKANSEAQQAKMPA